jgi:hypothetical protein
MTKNKYVVFTAAVLSTLMLEAACGNGPPRQNGGPGGQFHVRNIRGSAILDPEQKDGPRLNLDISILEARGPRDAADFFNLLLYNGQRASQYRESLAGMYRSAYGEIKGERENPGGFSPDWEYQESIDLEHFSGRWLVLRRTQESFTGGAHGISQKMYYVVDQRDLRVLGRDEFFIDPGSPEFHRLILEALREWNSLEKNAPLSSGIYFEDDPGVSFDFFLNREGMGFHWNPYEIAPYSAGHIEVIIPWEKLEGLLSEYGREAAALNS